MSKKKEANEEEITSSVENKILQAFQRIINGRKYVVEAESLEEANKLFQLIEKQIKF